MEASVWLVSQAYPSATCRPAEHDATRVCWSPPYLFLVNLALFWVDLDRVQRVLSAVQRPTC